jgi:hypothetical protein
MSALIARKLKDSREIKLADADARPVSLKLRDATARLFSPFL